MIGMNGERDSKKSMLAVWLDEEKIQNNIKLKLRGAYDKFPDYFCMGTFIDSTHIKL